MPKFLEREQASLDYDREAGQWLLLHPSPSDVGTIMSWRFDTFEQLAGYMEACRPAIQSGLGWRPPARDLTRDIDDRPGRDDDLESGFGR